MSKLDDAYSKAMKAASASSGDQKKKRFYVAKSDVAGWDLVDSERGLLLNHQTKKAAVESERFAKTYVKRWGDIDFSSFPYDLEQAPAPPTESGLGYMQGKKGL